MPNLLADLRRINGPGHVLTESDVVAGYATDWTRRYAGHAACVVRPGSTSQVSDVVRACAAHGAQVITQGGNTGLVGGSVPSPATSEPARVILSTRRLASLGPVDLAAAQVTAGAGVTIARLAAHAASAGLRYGVDLASRDSATVGGTIATNAGGIHTIRYGSTRSQLVGLTAVLADGSVVGNLSGLTAGDNGYDLGHLLTGSEGTLAVITEARLLLRPAEPAAAVLFCGLAGIAETAELTGRLKSTVPGLLAAEYVDAAGLTLAREAFGLPSPLNSRHPGYLLAEIAGTHGPRDVADYLAELTEPLSLPADTVIAQDARGMAALWAYRERLTEAIATAGIPHKIDVAVPADELGTFSAELNGVVRAAARSNGACASRAGPGPGPGDPPLVIVFGHVGVGNLHVNVLGPDPADTRVDAAVARLAAAHGGSVAAEHGVGRAKTEWLAWTKSPAEIAAMRAIKKALDPAGLLNPGVLLPPAVPPSS